MKLRAMCLLTHGLAVLKSPLRVEGLGLAVASLGGGRRPRGVFSCRAGSSRARKVSNPTHMNARRKTPAGVSEACASWAMSAQGAQCHCDACGSFIRLALTITSEPRMKVMRKFSAVANLHPGEAECVEASGRAARRRRSCSIMMIGRSAMDGLDAMSSVSTFRPRGACQGAGDLGRTRSRYLAALP